MTKTFIARNVVRPIVDKYVKRITPAGDEGPFYFHLGESFQVDEDRLEILKKAYPNEMEYDENLATKEELNKKDEEISKLKALLAKSKSKKAKEK